MRRLILLLVGVGAVVLVGVWLHARTAARSDAAGKASAASAADRVVPVRAAPVAVGDVPIYLEGLGSAVATSTVTVRSQVDGRLERVTFSEGQAVHKGDVLAQVDPRPFTIQLHQAQAALARDEAQLKNGELTLKRDDELVAKKLVPLQQVDDQRAQVETFKAAVQADQAQVESANLNLDYARITSPIDGITGVRAVDPGNLVHASDAAGIVVVAQLDPIAVVFTLPQDDLPRVSDAMTRGQLEVELQSRDGSTSLGQGQLLLIDNQINAATATLRLKALADNPKHVLWPNQFVKVRLRLAVQPGAKTVPGSAVQTGPDGQFVYVVKPDSTVAVQAVKVALVQGDTAIIASGLNGGESVVIDGQNQLRPGAKVSAKPAQASKGSDSARADADGGDSPKHRGGGSGGGSHHTVTDR